jgi:hypothetical protein
MSNVAQECDAKELRSRRQMLGNRETLSFQAQLSKHHAALS